jgi:hypothetical protein
MKEKLKELFAPCQPELAELKTAEAIAIFAEYVLTQIPDYKNDNTKIDYAEALVDLRGKLVSMAHDIMFPKSE